jgi:hypothetical protein
VTRGRNRRHRGWPVAVGDALADGSPPTLIEVGADVAPGPAVDEADPAARINDGP